MIENATVQQASAGFLLNSEFIGLKYYVRLSQSIARLFCVIPERETFEIDLDTITFLNIEGGDVTPVGTNSKASLLAEYVLGSYVNKDGEPSIPVKIESDRLFFGDDAVTTKRTTTLAEKWSQGLPLGGFTLTDGAGGYWEVIPDVNDSNYFDGAAEVGLRAGAGSTEQLLANSDRPNRYLPGHVSYFGYTIMFNSDNANGGFELLIGAFSRGALSQGRNTEIKDGMMWGQVSDDGISKKFIFRVYKNFEIASEDEFTPIWDTTKITIFEQLLGYYGVHPALLDVVIQEENTPISKERAFVKRFIDEYTSIADPNLSLGVMVLNKGNTGNIFMRNGSIEFGNYIEPRDNIDPTARDITHVINVATIGVDPDYTDGSGLLGAFTVPDMLSMVSKIEGGVATFSDFTSTITNRLFSIEGVASSSNNRTIFLNIDLLPKADVTLLAGQDYLQLNPGRNALAFASASQIDTINYANKVDATITRQISDLLAGRAVIDLEGVGSDLTKDFVAVASLSSDQTTTATDVSVSFITKDLF